MQSGSEWSCPFQEQQLKKIYPDYQQKNLQMLLMNKQIDYSLGCMFGSFIGDSLGSYLEFAHQITPSLIEQAMEMTPGGPFNLRSGQVTDDSEMSFCLLEALSHYDPHQPLEKQQIDLLLKISNSYVGWKKSKPFDMGITTRNAMKILQASQQNGSLKEDLCKQAFYKMVGKIAEVNKKSQSNGSLMRITPMVFGWTLMSLYNQEPDQASLKQFIEGQIKLVHSSPQIINSSLHWVRTLYKLTRRSSNKRIDTIYKESMDSAKRNIKDWPQKVQSQDLIPATVNIGWAKIAWVYGMQQLKKIRDLVNENPNFKFDQHYYCKVMRLILQRGGDTDTNMAIVGGMIGATVGFKGLPPRYISKMMNLDFSDKKLKRGNDRPQFFEPRNALITAYRSLMKLKSFKKEQKLMPKC